MHVGNWSQNHILGGRPKFPSLATPLFGSILLTAADSLLNWLKFFPHCSSFQCISKTQVLPILLLFALHVNEVFSTQFYCFIHFNEWNSPHTTLVFNALKWVGYFSHYLINISFIEIDWIGEHCGKSSECWLNSVKST